MIWHIFKKDVRLLWWLAAVVALLRFAEVATAQTAGLFPPARARNMMAMLAIGGILAMGFAICTVVHQDAIPGVRQDWLVRPIRRRDLVGAKLLFILLLIQLPIFIADLVQAYLVGASAGASLGSSFSHSVYEFLIIDLGFLAFASVTKNLLEAVTGGVAVSLTFAVYANLFLGDPSRRFQPTFGTGLEWITVSSLALMILTGSAVLLGLQYLRRKTFLSRCLTGTFTIFSLVATMVPWKPAFAIQKALSLESNSSASVAISLVPESKTTGERIYLRTDQFLPVSLPVRISGLPPNAGLTSDRTEIRLTERNGRSHNFAVSSRLSTHRTSASDDDQNVRQVLGVPGDLYRTTADETVRLDIEYWLTLFTLSSTHSLPALNANAHFAEVGWCGTRINAANTGVQLSCENAARPPGCIAVALENPATKSRNPETFTCEGADYGLYPNWQLLPDPLLRFSMLLPFRDQNGLTQYPVNASQLPEAKIAMRTYQPVDHFTRTLVIPEIRLSDWSGLP